MNAEQYLLEMRKLGFELHVVHDVNKDIKFGILKNEPDLSTEEQRTHSFKLEVWRQQHLSIPELARAIKAGC